jgi:hypothetical protein
MNDIEMDKIKLHTEIVKMSIKSLKSKISCAVGAVPAELLKSGTEKIYVSLRQTSERCLNGEEIPNDWKTDIFQLFIKKERSTNMKITEELNYSIEYF